MGTWGEQAPEVGTGNIGNGTNVLRGSLAVGFGDCCQPAGTDDTDSIFCRRTLVFTEESGCGTLEHLKLEATLLGRPKARAAASLKRQGKRVD